MSATTSRRAYRAQRRRERISSVLVLGALPLGMLALGSVPTTASYFYDFESISGGISAGEWPTTPFVPNTCRGGSVLDLFEAMDVDDWDIITLSEDEGVVGAPEGAVIRDRFLSLDSSKQKSTSTHGHGWLVVVESGDWTVIGSKQSDILKGGPGTNYLEGNNGDDCLIGGAGPNFLDAPLRGDNGPQSYNNHHDILIGGDGQNELWSGNSSDLLIGGRVGDNNFHAGNAVDTLIGGPAPAVNNFDGGHAHDRVSCWTDASGVVEEGPCAASAGLARLMSPKETEEPQEAGVPLQSESNAYGPTPAESQTTKESTMHGQIAQPVPPLPTPDQSASAPIEQPSADPESEASNGASSGAGDVAAAPDTGAAPETSAAPLAMGEGPSS